MAEDKWRIIDTHVNSMIDWTKGLSVTPTNNQAPTAQRPGHIHRKSEPDVVMIRQAQTAQRVGTLPVPPQSAPVQPGTFTLDWSSRQLPTRNDDPSILEGDVVPDKMMKLPELDTFKPTGLKSSHGNTTILSSQSRHNDSPSMRNQPVPSSTDHEQTGYMGVEAIPKPPPYPRVVSNGPTRPSRPFNGVGDSHIPHPPRIQDNPYKALITPRPTTAFGYQSPKTNRRSSMPGNHIDPRAQSSSPSVPRRSTSIQPTMPRRRTQDNFLPSMLPPQEIINPIPSHPIVTMPYPYNPKADSMITSFSSKKPDDQEYTKALLQHQQDRMQRLQKELEAKKELLESLNATVAVKEKESCGLRNEGLSKSMPTPEDIRALRLKNREMEIECNCMIQEVDMVSSSGHPSMEGNFHDYIIKKVPSTRKRHVPTDPLPSPPLPPPPDPPVDPGERGEEEDRKWSCKYCTFLNHSALDKCEVCEYRRHKAAAS